MLDTALLCYGNYRKQINISISVLMVWVFYLSFSSEQSIRDPSAVKSLHTDPPPARDFYHSERDKFESILTRNVSSLTEIEMSFFLSYKENQYRERRVKVKQYCNAKGPKFGKKIIKNSLIFDEKDGIGYCQIAKVASSTWCNHFISLANVTDKEYKKWKNALQLFAPSLWPAPSSNVKYQWNKVISIVIVRHPMSRLASVYYQKFIELYQNKGWAGVIKSIIKNYRVNENDGPEDQPTPNEFLRFVLDDLKAKERGTTDQHWRPQHLSCPFCLLDFSVYAKMEELDQDSVYFFSKANLTSRINYKQKLNSAHAASSTERKFWSQVDKEVLLKLEEPWAYQTDFEMFEYSVQEYLNSVGIIL